MTDAFTTLFWWMGHVGQGSSQRLHDAVQALRAGSPADSARREARLFLDAAYKLGHVEKPKPGYWRMEAPTLSLIADGGGAFWRGGLSPKLLVHAESAAAGLTQFSERRNEVAPPRLTVAGNRAEILRLAEELEVAFEDDSAARAATALPSLHSLPRPSSLPTTQQDRLASVWKADSAKGSLPSAEAIEFTPERGATRYFVRLPGATLEAESKWEAIYCAARRRERLCQYHESDRRFETHIQLPRRFARVLCLCSGELPKKDRGLRVYRGVPEEIAARLLARLGQDSFTPTIRWL